jgi:hypothetical protein
MLPATLQFINRDGRARDPRVDGLGERAARLAASLNALATPSRGASVLELTLESDAHARYRS